MDDQNTTEVKMSNKKDKKIEKEWIKTFNTAKSQYFLSQKSAEMIKKFQEGKLLPMD